MSPTTPLSLDRASGQPLYRQIEDQLRGAIRERRLRPGTRVPSIRHPRPRPRRVATDGRHRLRGARRRGLHRQPGGLRDDRRDGPGGRRDAEAGRLGRVERDRPAAADDARLDPADADRTARSPGACPAAETRRTRAASTSGSVRSPSNCSRAGPGSDSSTKCGRISRAHGSAPTSTTPIRPATPSCERSSPAISPRPAPSSPTRGGSSSRRGRRRPWLRSRRCGSSRAGWPWSRSRAARWSGGPSR